MAFKEHSRAKTTFKEYLKTQGKNQGSGFFGSWAWNSMKKKEYIKLYGDHDFPPDPPSQSKPGSFKKLSE